MLDQQLLLVSHHTPIEQAAVLLLIEYSHSPGLLSGRGERRARFHTQHGPRFPQALVPLATP